MNDASKRSFPRISGKRFAAALVVLLITFGIIGAIYSEEYSVNVQNQAQLEEKLSDYFFTEEDMETHILAGQQSGKTLYLLFERVGCPGIYGLAELEQGILGRYRFSSADLSNYPLYQASVLQAGKQNHLLIYGLYALPGVAAYQWYDAQNEEPGFVGEAETGPFLRIVDLPVGVGEETLWSDEAFRYLDSQGNELDVEALKAQLPAPASCDCPSVDSESASVLVAYLLPVALLGLAVTFGLLFGRKRVNTQDNGK